jgi:UDP-3-O-[3-hydroxymyristoyl] glucosamine N-acyltransferase
MADPRFYDNVGPVSLAAICAKAGVALPARADGRAQIDDVASLTGAGPSQLSFYAGGREAGKQFAVTSAGYCFIAANAKDASPSSCMPIPCASVQDAFGAAALALYPCSGLSQWAQQSAIDPTAEIGEGVSLAPGVVIGPGAAIGDRTRIGPNTVIGRGVAIGRDCEIGSNVSISHAYLGDGVLILSGAQIGGPGFGFSSSQAGHIKIPQLGRVILQDRVEIGACTAVDRRRNQDR